jgi:hypothetical protein
MVQNAKIMKTFTRIFLFFFFGSTQTLFAQNNYYRASDTITFKASHHLGIQAGTGSLPQVLSLFGEIFYSIISTGDNVYKNKTNSGALYAHYHYSPARIVRFGITAGIDNQRGDIVKEYGPANSYYSYASWLNETKTVALECLLLYNKNELVKLYGKLGFGFHQFNQTVNYVDPSVSNESVRYNYFTGQLTPFGIEVGKNVSGFAEFGFGYNGILSAGIRGKF